MEINQLCKNIETCCDALGKVKLLDIPLEECNPRLLDVREEDIDEHVSLQPAAIAYFGACRRQALRILSELEQDFEDWMKVQYSNTKAAMSASATKKPTVEDIRAQIIVDKQSDIDDWKKKIRAAQAESDLLDSYYEAWKQKGFSMKVHADLAMEELNSKPHIDGDTDGDNYKSQFRGRKLSSEEKVPFSEKKQRVRDIMNKKDSEGE
jgi:hypothetical protein